LPLPLVSRAQVHEGHRLVLPEVYAHAGRHIGLPDKGLQMHTRLNQQELSGKHYVLDPVDAISFFTFGDVCKLGRRTEAGALSASQLRKYQPSTRVALTGFVYVLGNNIETDHRTPFASGQRAGLDPSFAFFT
jgi:hypothetical protein